MKNLILILFCFIACTATANDLKMECSKSLSKRLYRCENLEVICYKFSGYKVGGLSCKWKGEKNENFKRDSDAADTRRAFIDLVDPREARL